MEPKFKAGDQVIVCSSLKTTIIEVRKMNQSDLHASRNIKHDKHSYWFLDENGRRWKASSNEIKKQK